MAREFILKENVLTDNVLTIAGKNMIFKGGYIAILKENVYLNPWQDKETIKKFKNVNRLNLYLDKHYPKAEIDFEGTCLE